jgi:(R,R)-butanediol dehydrogenase/meso-butanediol dehydrogenase/diacetyl reductase
MVWPSELTTQEKGKHMKAARWYKAGDIRVEDVPEPQIDEDYDVKVKVKWCGICGSDLHEYTSGPIFIPVGTPHPITGEVAPVIMGHEFSGEVVEVGPSVTNVTPGDRVVIEPMDVDNTCPACKEGRYNLCENLGFHGLAGKGGGFAMYTTFPHRFVHKIPDSLPFDKAALVEPISVGFHSLEAGGFKAGMSAVVAGAGTIGLATVQSLQAMGATKVIMIQRKSIRQEYARNCGVDAVLDPNTCDVVAEIKKLTDGRGADIAFETTGAEQCFKLELDSIHAGGTVVVTSIWENDVTFNLNSICIPEKRVVGSIAYCNDFPKVIDLLGSGKIPATGFITKKISLDDIIEEGFKTLTGPEKKKQVKILVTPEKTLLKQ